MISNANSNSSSRPKNSSDLTRRKSASKLSRNNSQDQGLLDAQYRAYGRVSAHQLISAYGESQEPRSSQRSAEKRSKSRLSTKDGAESNARRELLRPVTLS